ncbi:AAA family ATPase [Evansella sp. LMS18]|uniref:AAA family ATPase n=1 Tax=Evansella sp. LMS18 TaxID=2924033 RepID=UPI0020D0D332|nr:AAA family ATPase [Evansella sp. LMS18]UTR11515.1 AAA family ATPase [Evansella sp. LMS18]
MTINWYFFSDTNSLADELEQVINKKQIDMRRIHNLENINAHLQQTKNGVLFIKTNIGYNPYVVCRDIAIQFPHIYIVLIVPDNMVNVKKAMNAGASDIMRISSTVEEIKDAVDQAEKYTKQRENKQPDLHLMHNNSKIISVTSPRGGIGKTVLTVNLAAAFSKQGEKVAVLDANLQFGDAAMYFDLKPKLTIYEWVKEGYGGSEFSLTKYLVKHKCGISVLAAPPRPEFFEIINEEHIQAAIQELKKQFTIILIDLPAHLSEIHMKCLEESDDILMLSSTELPVLRVSKLYLDTLETIQVKEKVKVILRQLKNKDIDLSRTEEILETKVFGELPSQDNLVFPSVNEGTPFVLTKPRAPLSKAVLKLTGRMLSKKEPEIIKSKQKNRRKIAISL